MTLLEVQSEQLAIKLQRELDGESPDAHHHSVLSDAATGVAPDRPDEHSAAAEEQQPVPASQVNHRPLSSVPTVRQCYVQTNKLCTLHRQSFAAWWCSSGQRARDMVGVVDFISPSKPPTNYSSSYHCLLLCSELLNG